MLDIILDTDLGIDCDDAVALALLLKAEKAGKCKIKAITASTAREGATATADAICKFYGLTKPLAKLREPLACDATNNYARAVMQKYGTSDVAIDATELLRKTLAEADSPVALIAIGPLTNIANLLKTDPDGYSPLGGVELVKSKVKKLYIMGGCFKENNAAAGHKADFKMPEWNILQDIKSAQYVFNHLPVETLLVPHEAGLRVFTDMGEGDSPVWYSMEQFALNSDEPYGGGKIRRHSWDPITCLAAIDDLSPWFGLSPEGRIAVDDGGYTELIKGEGKCRFFTVKGGFDTLGAYINQLMAN